MIPLSKRNEDRLATPRQLHILATLSTVQEAKFAPVQVQKILFLIGNLALQHSAARLPANVLSVLMLAEILVATVSSWLGGAAVITQSTLIGGAFIVCASLLAVLSGRNAA